MPYPYLKPITHVPECHPRFKREHSLLEDILETPHLLTGYAQYYNRRHKRHGQLFQNRYKSILCQEEPYMLELVRYIHLNPLRAGKVKTLEELDEYPFSGHSALMGTAKAAWQDVDFVLGHFGEKTKSARKHYHAYVDQGYLKDAGAILWVVV